ncbi:hypothetical protein [Mesorhizobium sp. M1295]|uniref:hypothetical protein n=1 Tax=Mesorhizobium sp. M1295 TaxID=2957076 RepID=UPI003337EFCC
MAKRYGINQEAIAKWRGEPQQPIFQRRPKGAEIDAVFVEEEAIIVAAAAARRPASLRCNRRSPI